MEVASGEYGEQMVRLVKAVQKDDQTELNGDTNLQPLLWQRAEEVRNKRSTSDTQRLTSYLIYPQSLINELIGTFDQ